MLIVHIIFLQNSRIEIITVSWNHQGLRIYVNIEIIVEHLPLLSSGNASSAWLPRFALFRDSGCTLVIKTHCVYDTYPVMLFTVDVCMN